MVPPCQAYSQACTVDQQLLPFVEVSGALAEIRRMYSRSFNDRSLRLSKALKIQRFSQSFLSADVLRNCESWTPRLTLGLSLCERRQECKVLRIVLPYSARWSRLQSKLRRIHEAWLESLRLLGFTFVVQVSFSKGSQPLWARVRHLGLEP
jgi:hypothetical protein